MAFGNIPLELRPFYSSMNKLSKKGANLGKTRQTLQELGLYVEMPSAPEGLEHAVKQYCEGGARPVAVMKARGSIDGTNAWAEMSVSLNYKTLDDICRRYPDACFEDVKEGSAYCVEVTGSLYPSRFNIAVTYSAFWVVKNGDASKKKK